MLLFTSSLAKNSGQTLIEALVALGIGVVVVSAMAVAVISALSNAQFSRNQNFATQHAQQDMEFMRKLRDSSWGSFAGLSANNYCLDANTVLQVRSGANCSPHAGSIFRRSIDIEHRSQDCNNGIASKVTVLVEWSDSKCTRTNLFCHKVNLVSCLANTSGV